MDPYSDVFAKLPRYNSSVRHKKNLSDYALFDHSTHGRSLSNIKLPPLKQKDQRDFVEVYEDNKIILRPIKGLSIEDKLKIAY